MQTFHAAAMDTSLLATTNQHTADNKASETVQAVAQHDEQQPPPPSPPQHYRDDALAVGELAGMSVSPYSQRHSLYISYLFAAFGDRMWEFASLVFLMSLFPTSLLAASLLGLLETGAAIVCSPALGRYIDRTSRLQAALCSVAGQNIAVSAGGVILYFLLTTAETGWLTERGRWIGWALLSVAAMVARVSSSLNKLSIHKSWVPVIATEYASPLSHSDPSPQQPSSVLLSSLNGVMRGIDLSSSIVAPLLVGVLSSLWSELIASAFVGCWSMASLLLECYLVQRVWDKVPQLHYKQQNVDGAAEAGHATKASLMDAAKQYWHHPLFAPSLAYCLLYISVLSFGGIMTSYLASDLVHLSDALLAVGRALAAIVGLLATLATPRLIPRFGLVRSGSLLIVCQCACLAAVVAAFTLPSLSRTLFLVLLFAGLSLSRFGLWGFDLVETQLLQEGVEESAVGAVNGMQESLMNVCFMLSFCLTILFAEPSLFVWPAWISFGSVVLAMLIYLRWAMGQSTPTQS